MSYDFKYKVTYKNDDGIEVKEIVEPRSERMVELFGKVGSMKLATEKVNANFKNGVLGKAKLFNLRRGNNNYKKLQLNYEVVDDNLKILDFKPFKVLGYLVDVSHREESDLLKVDLGKSEFAVTSKSEVKNIRYVLNLIQRINNELLDEVENDNDFDFNDEEVEDDIQEIYADNQSSFENSKKEQEKVEKHISPSDIWDK